MFTLLGEAYDKGSLGTLCGEDTYKVSPTRMPLTGLVKGSSSRVVNFINGCLITNFT